MHHVLFPLGVRLSTWAMLAAFLFVAVRCRNWRAFLYAWTWMWGFEAAYDASVILFRHPTRQELPLPAFYLILGVATLFWMTREMKVRPVVGPMVGVAAIWIAWVLIGFPVNTHDATAIDPTAEILNESAKTLWALAYLIPLWSMRPASARLPAGRTRSMYPIRSRWRAQGRAS